MTKSCARPGAASPGANADRPAALPIRVAALGPAHASLPAGSRAVLDQAPGFYSQVRAQTGSSALTALIQQHLLRLLSSALVKPLVPE